MKHLCVRKKRELDKYWKCSVSNSWWFIWVNQFVLSITFPPHWESIHICQMLCIFTHTWDFEGLHLRAFANWYKSAISVSFSLLTFKRNHGSQRLLLSWGFYGQWLWCDIVGPCHFHILPKRSYKQCKALIHVYKLWLRKKASTIQGSQDHV